MRTWHMLGVGGLLLTLSFVSVTDPAYSMDAPRGASAANDAIPVTIATQQIEYLRKHYARATDQIGTNTEAGIAAGREVYRAIFTPDVTISASNGDDADVFRAQGPDAWVHVAAAGLAVFDSTQHLIGTQIVSIDSLPNGDGEGGMPQ